MAIIDYIHFDECSKIHSLTIPFNCYGLITNNKNYNGLVNFFKILINFLRAILKELIYKLLDD